MNVKFLNPFLEALFEVIKAELGISATRGELSVCHSSLTTEDITVLVHLVGEVDGVVMYGMPAMTGVRFVSQILGQEFNEMNTLAQSGVAELGNVISGRATIKFSQHGFSSEISTPMVISGKGVQVSTLDFPRIVVPVMTNLGNMTVHLALREHQSVDSKEQFVNLIVTSTPD